MMGIDSARSRTYAAAFLIGGVMGLMAEMAAGLILYEGSGLMRATTVILTTEAAAAATGLIVAARVPVEEVVRQLRRHLHLTLISLGLAGILTSLWGYLGGLSEVPGGQAVALALLAALPLYMTGAVLGLVCRTATRHEEGAVVAEGGIAMLGAATGFLLYGLFLVPGLAPPVLVLLCMAAVSGAALVHGAGGRPGMADPDDPDDGRADASEDGAGADTSEDGAAGNEGETDTGADGADPDEGEVGPDEDGVDADGARAQEADPGASGALEDAAEPEAPGTLTQPQASREPVTHAILERPETSRPSPAQELHHPPERAGIPES